MPSRKATKVALAASARMLSIPKEIIDQFVTGPMMATAVNDLSIVLRKVLIERALNTELPRHPGYPPALTSRWMRTTIATVSLGKPTSFGPSTALAFPLSHR